MPGIQHTLHYVYRLKLPVHCKLVQIIKITDSFRTISDSFRKLLNQISNDAIIYCYHYTITIIITIMIIITHSIIKLL